MQLAMQGIVIQLMSPAPSENDDIHGGETLLLKTKGFTDEAFQTVTVDGTTHVLLAEDESHSRRAESIGARQHQKAFAVHLEGRMSEDVLIVPGGQQS
ncbi:hypothetical protein C8E00_104363 [Chromohalobacter marismortui]|uniref:Uncharacterized protein n=1 Tax=Chromohalobacter marismortui TaxID=42055 RepID=A0A4R7NNH9_9GAMM|nr:hypothetical protein C8E00_104363 [Chromohalobacter marismortui]